MGSGIGIFGSFRFPNIQIFLHIKWFHYIDDTFVLLPTQTNREETLNALNPISESIQFTLETEKDSRIPFLDVLVQRNTYNFQNSVHRKPTSTNSWAHFFPNHNRTIKKSVASSAFLWALRFSSPRYLLTEIDTIYSNLQKLAYPKHFIDNVYSTIRNRFNNPT